MSISKDLFLAILSMDAYNRGYGAGIDDGVNALDGTANGLGGLGSIIGAATVTNENVSPSAQNAGFYALSYEIAAGEQIDGLSAGDVVISYRGTDNPDPTGFGDGASDLWNGWITGAGVNGSQSWLALDFFKSVTNSDALQRERRPDL